MPEQFVVPQFIESEDKIFGPVTARQFIILMIVMLLEFVLFRLLSLTVFLLTGIPLFIFSVVLAFVKINGAPFHYFLINVIQTFKKPRVRVWQHRYTDADIKDFMKEIPPVETTKFTRKAFTGSSRLQELTLVVNTGGVYKPEE